MKLLLFDIDGTLIRGGGAGRRSLVAAFREVFDLGDADGALDHVELNGRTDPAIVRDLARAMGVDAGQLEDHLEEVFGSYLRHLQQIVGNASGASLCPGFPELLDRLEDRTGVTLGLLTGNVEAGARVKLAPFDLNRYFAAGGFGSDSDDRGVIAATARKKFEVIAGHPIGAADVLVIGDTTRDVDCGRVNSFKTLAVGTGGVPMSALEGAGPDLLYETLGDVAGVVADIERLMELPAR